MIEWFTIMEILTLALALSYALVVWILASGIERRKTAPDRPSSETQGVSLVIPFRNEEAHLPDLLNDLLRQDYPAEHMEIILVDDHSTDRSADVIAGLISSSGHIRCLDLPGDLSGKKMALRYGIERAQFDRIIQTDADCRVGPGFIGAHLSFLEKYPSDMVAGLVTTGDPKGRGNLLLRAFERLELLSLMGTGAGSFRYGHPVMCSGANLSYTRQLYMDTRAFDPSARVASGDDMFLMIGARKLGRRLSFLNSRAGMVQTAPVGSPAELLRQRIRWGGKSVHYRMTDIQMLAVLVAMTNLAVLFAILLMWGGRGWNISLPGAVLLKTAADFTLLCRITGLTGQRTTLWWFPVVSLLYYLYFPVVLTGSFLRASDWKERSILR